MLGQPINNSQTIIEEQNTMQNEATNLVSAPAPSLGIMTAQPHAVHNPFEVKAVDTFFDPDSYHTCAITSSSLYISEEPSGDPSTPIKNLTIHPSAIVEYDRLNYGDGVNNSDREKVLAFNGIVEIEGKEHTKEDYLEEVRKTYPDAKWDRRGCLYGHIIEVVLLDNKVHEKLRFPKFVQVFLAPTSLRAWNSIKTTTEFNCQMGIPVGNCVMLSTQIAKSNKGKSKGTSWTKFTFEPVNVGPDKLNVGQYTQQPQILDNAA